MAILVELALNPKTFESKINYFKEGLSRFSYEVYYNYGRHSRAQPKP